MKAIISLFDYTTEAVKPWAKDGYTCFCFDIQHEKTTAKPYGDGYIIKCHNDLSLVETLRLIKRLAHIYDIHFMSAFPPCTDLAVSGAKHFKSKEEKDPHYRKKAMNLVYTARDIGEMLGCPYYIENPVSVISTEWRNPDYIFHPYEFGGYIPKNQENHPTYPNYIMPSDAYPKKTCLWTGNGFIMPEKKPVAVREGYSVQFHKLGGKSLKTKNIRSATPRGFTRAVKLFNEVIK